PVGPAFSGKRRCIERRGITQHTAIKGNTLPCLYLYGVIDTHLCRIGIDIAAVSKDGGCIRPNVKQGAYAALGAVDSRALKQLAYCIKQHYGYSLRILADVEGPQCRYAHQEKLCK